MSEESVDAMVRAAGNPKTALDIACGTGDLAVKLARRGLVVTGTDVSKVALEKARAKLSAAGVDATLVEADFNKADFASTLAGPFDLVVIRLSLAFVDDKESFLASVRKLVGPGGAFVCSTPVLLPGEMYDDRQTRISVEDAHAQALLRQHFSSVVELIADEVARPQWPLRTYFCHP